MLYTVLAALGLGFILTILVMVMGSIKSKPIFEEHEANFVFVLIVFGSLFSAGAFQANRSKAGITEYLMIPASTWEKFISEALLSFSFSFVFYIVYWLYALIINSFLSGMVNAYFMPFNLDLSYYCLALVSYVFGIGIFQFGAITFRQMPFLKVLLWALPFFAIVFLLKTSADLSQNSLIGYDEYTHRSISYTPLVQYSTYLAIPVGFIFWVLTYLKLKEKEA